MGAFGIENLEKVKGDLVGLNGNAFSLMGYFSSQAEKQGWKKEAIDEVLTEAKSSDYSHLISTLLDHMESE